MYYASGNIELMHDNSTPLSDRMVLTLVSNCLSTKTTNGFIWGCVLALDTIGKTQTYLVWSSTMVKKYLWPCKEVTTQGPQILTCNK